MQAAHQGPFNRLGALGLFPRESEWTPAPLLETLERIRDRVGNSGLVRFVLSPDFHEKASFLDRKEFRRHIPVECRMQLAGVPLDAERDSAELEHALRSIASGRLAPLPSAPESQYGGSTRAATDREAETAERLYRHLSAYCWLHFRFPEQFPAREEAEQNRRRCAQYLIRSIARGLRRRCRECNGILPFGHAHAICEPCYRGRFQGDYY